jgi:AAA-like domain
MTVEEALAIVDAILAPERLNSLQELVFRNCWAGQTYQEIAQSAGYDPDYIRLVGCRLWQTLAKATGEKITKSNVHVVLRQCSCNDSVSTATSPVLDESEQAQLPKLPLPEFPGGPRPLTCPYYVEFPSVIEDCYQEITKPGALVRIKSPEKRGKSSLMLRILAHAELQGYQTVRLNLQQVEGEALNNLDRFLRWFCANIAQQLKLEPKLDHYWDVDLGSKISCTSYLQGHVLAQLDSPLVIALDEVHRLFEYPEIAQEFLPLLRLWHEEANNLDVWAKLCLIVVYSTEVYIPLDLNQSPFNVGLPIRLPTFDLEQTQTLALRYGLTLTDNFELQDLISLRAMVDGHPYLLNLAFYHLYREAISIEQLLNGAPTQTSIYSEHLRSCLTILQQSLALSTAFREVVAANVAVRLKAIPAYQLESMGLVNLHGDMATPSCNLYRLYFRDRLT